MKPFKFLLVLLITALAFNVGYASPPTIVKKAPNYSQETVSFSVDATCYEVVEFQAVDYLPSFTIVNAYLPVGKNEHFIVLKEKNVILKEPCANYRIRHYNKKDDIRKYKNIDRKRIFKLIRYPKA